MAQTYPAVQVRKSSPQADIVARGEDTHLRVTGGDVKIAYGSAGIEDAMPLFNGESWSVPSGTAVRVYYWRGEPTIFTMGQEDGTGEAVPAPTAPAAITDWTLATGLNPSELVLAINTLPSNGGSAITALQWTRDGGTTWTALSGTGTGSRTLTMPAAGTSYTISVRAVNAVGNGAASTAKTATSGAAAPVITAPTAVALSATSSTVQSDATVPRTLATLSANGTQPVTWSLVSGPSWATIDTSGAQPALRITTVPAAGDHTLTVRATNSAGSVQATYTLTVQAAQAGEPVTTNTGTITSSTTNPDGSLTLTISGAPVAQHNGTYTVPAQDLADGMPGILRMPVISENPTGSFATAQNGLYWFVPGEGPSVLSFFDADGKRKATGPSYVVDPVDAPQELGHTIELRNLATDRAGRVIAQRQVIRAASSYTWAAAKFNAPQNDLVTFTTPAEEQIFDRAVFYARFRPRPDAGDTSLTGTIARLGSTSVEMTGNSALDMRALLRGTPSTQAYLDGKGFAAGDVIDVFVLYGLPFAITDARVSCKLRVLRNGVPLPEVNSLVDGANRLRIGPSEVWTLGGRVPWGANDGGITHEQFRVFYAPGAMAASLDEMQSRFLTKDGQLTHPDIAQTAFSGAMLDFRNGANTGTVGAPTSATNLT